MNPSFTSAGTLKTIEWTKARMNMEFTNNIIYNIITYAMYMIYIYIMKNIVGPRPLDGRVGVGWGGACINVHVNVHMK